MKKGNCREHFRDSLGSIRFRDTMLGVRREQVKQVTSTSKFCNNKQLIIDAKDIIKSNDIGVTTQFAKDVDFFL
jgi:hypothetical protein